MREVVTAVTGILLSVLFIVGFLVLFVINPQAFEEINNVSLSFYNLEGMNGRVWAASVIYSTVGALAIVFSSLLPVPSRNNSAIIAGKILLLVSGIVWLTFGLFPYDAKTDLGINLMISRIAAVILTGSIGLVVLGAELTAILKSQFMKWYTLSSGLAILLLASISVFVFDASWARTNVSFAIYFFWFGVFGLVLLRERTYR